MLYETKSWFSLSSVAVCFGGCLLNYKAVQLSRSRVASLSSTSNNTTSTSTSTSTSNSPTLTRQHAYTSLTQLRVGIKDITVKMPNWKTYESAIRLLSAVVAANPDIKLNYQDISKAFGGDCTVSALENRFRRIKADAKSIRDALSEGIDPITLELASKGSKAIADLHGCGMNKKAAWDRLAPIRKDAQALKDALENGVDPTTVNIGARGRDGKQSVADQYGDGVTAKAVSNRFERVKKEPAWVGKGKANGKSTKAKNSDANGETGEELDEDASDDAEDFKTPTKNGKSLSRKVKEGRVTKKSTPRKNNGAGVAKDVAAMALSDKEEDQEMGIIKGEGGIHPDELLGFADGNGDFCNAGEELEDEA